MAKTEMERALEADGEKLRALTGEDHGPWQIFTCEACDGRGYTSHRITVYEHGCGFPHDDTEERQCPECSGYGEFIGHREGDAVPAKPRWWPSATCPKCRRTRHDFDCAEGACPMAALTSGIRHDP